MLRSLGARASRPQVGGTVPEWRMGFISVSFLNRKNTKKHEYHEIFSSQPLKAGLF